MAWGTQGSCINVAEFKLFIVVIFLTKNKTTASVFRVWRGE